MSQKTNKNDRNHDTFRSYTFIPIGSTVAIQWEVGGRWTHGTVVGKGDHNHKRSYTTCVKKTG